MTDNSRNRGSRDLHVYGAPPAPLPRPLLGQVIITPTTMIRRLTALMALSEAPDEDEPEEQDEDEPEEQDEDQAEVLLATVADEPIAPPPAIEPAVAIEPGPVPILNRITREAPLRHRLDESDQDESDQEDNRSVLRRRIGARTL